IDQAIELSKICPNSAAIHSKMNNKERSEIIQDFRNGKIRTLFNVRVLSTGFDYTGIDCIIFGMATASFALYYQIIGRATRIDENKKDALIIDFSGMVKRFGKVEDITFRKEKRSWHMYGSKGVQLTNVPVHEMGQELGQAANPTNSKTLSTMPF